MENNNQDSESSLRKQFISMMKKAKRLRKIITLRKEDQIRSNDVMQMRFEYKKTHNKPNKKTHNKPNKKGQKTK